MDPNEEIQASNEAVEQTGATPVDPQAAPEADTSPSPGETDGAPSSGAAAEDEKSPAEHIRDEFLKKFGEPEDDPADADKSEAERKEASEPKTEAKDDETSQKDDGEADEHRLSDEDFKSLSDGAKKRIGYLNGENKKLAREIEEFRKPAEDMGKMREFAQANHIQPDDVTMAFGAMADLRQGRFQDFLDKIGPYVSGAKQALGQELPTDLQKRVDDGYLSDEDARELVKAKAARERATEEATRERQAAETLRQSQSIADKAKSIGEATGRRETELRGQDPDYAHLEPVIGKIMEGWLTRGALPQSPEDAVKMVNEAYELAKSTAPAPQAKPTPPSPTATRTAPSQRAEPETARDAIIESLVDWSPPRA